MKIVIDVNVWVSGLLWGGTPDQVLRLVRQKQVASYVSPALIKELKTTLAKSKFRSKMSRQNQTAAKLIVVAVTISQSVEIKEMTLAGLRDPKDAKILATAIAAQADVLVTGDRDLLVLQSVQGISILTPAQFLALAQSI